MGPEKAANIFKQCHLDAEEFEVTLFGSLAKTGKGHMTDAVIKDTLAPTPCKIIFDTAKQDLPHPNTMVFSSLKGGKVYDTMEVYSVGGGSIEIKGRKAEEEPIVYRQSTFNDIAAFCTQRKIRLWQYVEMTIFSKSGKPCVLP